MVFYQVFTHFTFFYGNPGVGDVGGPGSKEQLLGAARGEARPGIPGVAYFFFQETIFDGNLVDVYFF